MSLTDNLIEHWKLDAASGDEIGSHAGIVLTDGNSVGTAAGKINGARDFENASNHFMSAVDSVALSAGDIDFTIAGWMKLESVASSNAIGKWNATGNQREWFLRYSTTTAAFEFLASSDGIASTTVTASNFGAATAGPWYYVIAWHDAANDLIGIQVNNTTPNTVSHAAGVFDSTSAFQLGRIGVVTTSDWDGLIDEVSFWKRLLTADEKTALYNSGDGLAYPFALSGPTPIAVIGGGAGMSFSHGFGF